MTSPSPSPSSQDYQKNGTFIKKKNAVVTVLDIGSRQINCVIARTRPQKQTAKKGKKSPFSLLELEQTYDILGQGQQESQGIENGAVKNIDLLENSIRKAVHNAEQMYGQEIQSVIVNISTPKQLSLHISVDLSVGGRLITEEDIQFLTSQKNLHPLLQEKSDYPIRILHTIPLSYAVDGEEGIHSPLGMFAERLTAELHIIGVSDTAFRNLVTAVQRCYLKVQAVAATPYMAGLGCLTEDERRLGVTVIDLGEGITSIASFVENHLIFSDILPFGAHHITEDIARALSTTAETAERLKVLYGSAIVNKQADETLTIQALGSDTSKKIPRSILVGIIQPRVEEIFDHIKTRLDEVGLLDVMGQQIVLTGGGAELASISQLASQIFKCKVRIGKPFQFHKNMISAPAYSTVAGLLKFDSSTYVETAQTYEQKQHKDLKSTGFWKRLFLWLKENF